MNYYDLIQIIYPSILSSKYAAETYYSVLKIPNSTPKTKEHHVVFSR